MLKNFSAMTLAPVIVMGCFFIYVIFWLVRKYFFRRK